LHLERLPELSELNLHYVLPKEVFLQDSVQYMSSCSLREATNATMLHAVATQATALRGLALDLDQQRTSGDPLSGDLGLLEDLPRHEALSHFTFHSDFESANVALKLLADAPALYSVSIRGVKVPPELLEPLTKARKLKNLIINRQQYVRSFRPADGQPWYSPDP
jgi:hypothetical protein